MTSPDGVSWTVRASAADNQWLSVTYGNGLFVAVANTGTGNRVMTSPDGIAWTSRTSAADNSWEGVTYANNMFVAVASGASNGVMTMSPPVNWAQVGWGNYGTITANSNDPTQGGVTTNNVAQNYITNNNFGVTNSVATSKYAQWDFDVSIANAPYEASYCFRVVSTAGTTLSSYGTYPQITRCTEPPLSRRLRHGAAFCNGSKMHVWSSTLF
jgi:hypothetical protein